MSSKIVILMGAALATACSATPPSEPTQSSIDPLLVSNGQQTALLGTFDKSTKEIWLTSNVVQRARTLAEKQGVRSSQIVVVSGRTQLVVHDGVVTLPPALDPRTPLRACIVDIDTATRYRIAEFSVGAPSDMTLQAFVPSQLAKEEPGTDLCAPWELCPPP